MVADHGITALWLTAGPFHLMADTNAACFTGLRRMLTGGDVVSTAAAERVLGLEAGVAVTGTSISTGPTSVSTVT
ncbi:hypothetical protein GCM10011609_88390 [Lentzea pudingi]|uniref:Uncharacterized protein n=1 Tax=Lentzea pudingi TaxID=1789439 RepID=A0ABQ2IX77_9PSEU|nr:hypothetical protein GCM10011609_88390 [Lentzea pudingi]